MTRKSCAQSFASQRDAEREHSGQQGLFSPAYDRPECGAPQGGVRRDCIAHYADDIQFAAWLDVAALTQQYRRAFALDCQHFRQRNPFFAQANPPATKLHRLDTPDDTDRSNSDDHATTKAQDYAAATDFAREWLARNKLPSSYRRETQTDLASTRQGLYGTTRVAALHRWLRTPNRHFLTLLDANYPARLCHLDDPPPVIYVQGAIECLHHPMIAIVGSRRATAQGHESAAFLAAELAARGWSIVSGMANGIDAAAHRAALPRISHGDAQRHLTPDSRAERDALSTANALPLFNTASDASSPPQASTIAVIGTGIDQIYPASNAALRDAIGQYGAILSEWPLGTPPKAAHFPQRNRLIAALSQGVVVVEAALRSGSLITARLANELGREVFALPGSIFSPQVRGCHALIKEGATLVESVEDILDGLLPHAAPHAAAGSAGQKAAAPMTARSRPSAKQAPPRVPSPGPHPPSRPPSHAPQPPALASASPRHRAMPDEPVLAAVGHDAVPLDVLCARTGLSAAVVTARLAAYEIEGLINSSGGRFTRGYVSAPRKVERNVLKSTLTADRAGPPQNGPIQAPTGNVVESAADSAPRQTEADESAIRPGQP